jgi:threonine/homoserine/homoserine lactone efflux protein
LRKEGLAVPAPEILATFFLAALLLAVAPGPDNLFVLTQAALRGRMAGMVIVLGLCSGLLVHTMAVTVGVAVIFQTSTLAFTLLKSIGAAYLLYLAWHAWRAPAIPVAPGAKSSLNRARLYRRGMVMNVTNPKVTLFFLAFLPQFADPARGPLPPQMLLLGGIFILATILVFGGIALLAGTLGERLGRSPQAQKLLHRAAATVFVVLALKLILAEN